MKPVYIGRAFSAPTLSTRSRYAYISTSLGWHRRILLALAFALACRLRLWLPKRVGHLVLSLLELALSLSQAELSLLQLEVCFTSLTLGLALGINAFPLLLFLVLLVAFNKIGEATDTTAAAADAQHPPANG